MADEHYAKIPHELFDEAILWLGGEYGLHGGDERSAEEQADTD